MIDKTNDSKKYRSKVKSAVDALVDMPVADIIAAIVRIATGIRVADDGEIPMAGHTKSKLTITYPDGSKGCVITRTARSMYNGPRRKESYEIPRSAGRGGC